MQEKTEKSTKKINTIALLGTNVSWAALDLFISTFLVARLSFQIGIASVALFYIVLYTTLFIFYAIFAYIVKKFSAVWCIRLGVLIQVILICLICAFPKDNQLENLYLVFAALCGVANGIFWIALNSFTSSTMGGTSMLRFQMYVNIATSAARIILPFTLGLLITYVGFLVAAIVAFGIGVILILFTLIMRADKNSSPYSMKRFFILIHHEKLIKPVALNFLLQFLRALFLATSICVVILIAKGFGKNGTGFTLGYLTSIFAACAIIMLTSYRLIKSRKIKNNIFLACAIIAAGLAAGLLFKVDKMTIILFQLASVVFLIVPNIEIGKLQFDVMKELGHGHVSTEGLVVAEFAYFLARLSVVGLILLGSYIDSFLMFRILVSVFMVMPLIAFVVFRIWWHLYGKMIPRAPIPVKVPRKAKNNNKNTDLPTTAPTTALRSEAKRTEQGGVGI